MGKCHTTAEPFVSNHWNTIIIVFHNVLYMCNVFLETNFFCAKSNYLVSRSSFPLVLVLLNKSNVFARYLRRLRDLSFQ